MLLPSDGLYIEASLGAEPPLSLEAKAALYRIAQEARNCAVKHAQARKVHLRLQQQDGRLELEIPGDGVGFDSQREYPGHLGLVSLHKRIERLGGRLGLAGSLGAGSCALPQHADCVLSRRKHSSVERCKSRYGTCWLLP